MTPQEMVLEFHRTFNCSEDDRSADTIEARMEMIDEEWGEVVQELVELGSDFAETARPTDDIDWNAVAKELADLVYVTYGTAIALGINLDRAVELVHESNMNKLWPDGRPRWAVGGKVLKPPTYEDPDLTETVKEL